MAKKEVKTDLWVASQLKECGIEYDAQGSNVKELDEALKTASKRGTGKAGYPEYVSVVDDYVIVIEDKADLDKQKKLTKDGVIDIDVKAVTDYAVNGAYFYAKHIAQNSSFKKVFAVGVSGDEKHHEITPLYVDDREGYKELPDLESFVSFSPQNIREYYTRYVLEEETDVEKTTAQILKDAAELHEYLRTYGTLKDQDKPLVVAGILLALDEIEYGGFSIDSLTGDQTPGMRDGDKLMNAIKGRLTRSNVGPDAKKDKLLSEFSIIQTSFRLNEKNDTLGKTPLKYYTEFLNEKVFKSIKYQKTSEDFIGRFYGEFMSYSGGDGQTLGIILTPRHITDLMCDLVNVGPDDVVLEKSIREKLPNARWVIDHFHVVGYANKALDYVRIKIQRSLSKRERIKTKKGLAYSLRTRRKDLTPEDAEKIRELRSLPKRLPMAIAYDLKEQFFEIYDNNMVSKDNAIQAYKEWLKKIPPAPSPNEIDEKTQKPKPDLYKGFRELGKTVINFYDQIFNYWDCPLAISNGFTECSNRLIRERNLRGRGYSFEVLRARSLYRSANLDLMLKSNMVQFGPPIQQTADIITAETDSQVSGLTDNEDLESEEYEDNVLDTIDFYYND